MARERDDDPTDRTLDDAIARFADGVGPVRVGPEAVARFLDETSRVGLPAAERLRQLAMALEDEPFEAGWEGLARLYDRAAACDSSDPRVLHSRAVSAVAWLQRGRSRPVAELRRVVADALLALDAAEAFAPHDPELAHQRGLVHYHHPHDTDARLVSAGEAFEEALRRAPDHPLYTLYAAHVLHDRGMWTEAAERYGAVDPEALLEALPGQVWRVLRWRGQHGLALARAGRTDEARTVLHALFDAVAAADPDDLWLLTDLDEASEAVWQVLRDPALARRLTRAKARLEAVDPAG